MSLSLLLLPALRLQKTTEASENHPEQKLAAVQQRLQLITEHGTSLLTPAVEAVKLFGSQGPDRLLNYLVAKEISSTLDN